MIRLLFHHRSHAIDIVEFLSVLALAAIPWRLIFEDSGTAAWLLLGLIAAEYGFIRYCATVRWYKPCLPAGRDAARFEGVELQFKKALSPTVYIMLVGGIVFQLIPSTIVIAITALLLAVIAHINAILIYLHRRDPSTTPVNFYSHNKRVTRDT